MRASNLPSNLGLVNRYLGDTLSELNNTLHASRRRRNSRIGPNRVFTNVCMKLITADLNYDVTVCSASRYPFMGSFWIHCAYKLRRPHETPQTTPHFVLDPANLKP
jgi:hypothetical protein